MIYIFLRNFDIKPNMACFQNFVIKDFQLVQETNKCIFMECVMLLLFCLIYKEIIFIGTGL